MKFIDGHCDTITTAIEKNQKLARNNLHIDFEKLKNNGADTQFFAIWLDKKYYKNAFDNTIKAINFFESELQNPENSFVKKATSYKEILKNRENNFINAILTVEGGEAFEGKIENIQILFQKGIRLATICWNYENELGFGAVTQSKNGLKDFGIKAVKKMNELGILIDVSHLNEMGFWDICEKSQKPFIASHSNAKKLCNHCRNLSDNQLIAMKDKECVVGINLYPPFLNESGEANMNDILKHTEHLMNKIGEKRVVLGCDFDGIGYTPKGINDINGLKFIYDVFCNEFGKNIANDIFFNNFDNFLMLNM